MKKLLAVICVLVLSVSFMACDDGGDSNNNNNQQDVAAGDQAEEDTGVEQDLAVDPDQGEPQDVPESDNVVGTGACINDSDDKVLAGDGREAVSDTAKECGSKCLNGVDKIKCSTDCILAVHTLTNDCAECYATLINCSISNCLVECIADPDAPGCLDCQDQKGCRSAFYVCSGLPEEE